MRRPASKADLLEAAWKCFLAAAKVARLREAAQSAYEVSEAAKKDLQRAQTEHSAAAQLQREIEETLVQQHNPQQESFA